MTQRIEHLFSWTWRRELNLSSWTWRREHNPKNWTLFEYDSMDWTFFNVIQRIELLTQRIVPFWKFDSKNWTIFFTIWLTELNLFFYMAQRIEPFLFLNITLRIEPDLCFKKKKQLELISFSKRMDLFFTWHEELNLFFWNVTQRIEPFFFWLWLKELNCFFNYDSKNWTLWCDPKNWTPLFECDSKNWTLLFECDSKNWTFFYSMSPKEILWKICLKELNPFFLNMTQKKNWSFFKNMTLRIDPFKIRLKELNFLYSKISKNWTNSFWMTPRIQLSF